MDGWDCAPSCDGRTLTVGHRRRIGEGDRCLQGVRWSSLVWAQEAARQQEPAPVSCVDVSLMVEGEKTRAWSEYDDEAATRTT